MKRTVLLALGGVLLMLPARGEELDPGTRRLLAVVRRDDDPEAWTAAVRSLRARGGEVAEALDSVLRALLAERQRDLEDAARDVAGLAAAIGDGEREAPRLEAWRQSAGFAREWIFDRKAFPDIDGPIPGPQQGYDEAMRRAKLAIRASARLRPLLDRALSPMRRVSPERAEALRRAVRDAATAVHRVASELGETPPEDPEIPPLAWTLLDVAADRFDAVATRHREMPAGWARRCVFEAYGRAVLTRNTRDSAGMRRPAVGALEELNLYRMALGFTPLAHDARLVKAADAHSREMSRLGYFGHESPDPETRMPGDRARRAGYRAAVAECISARGDPKTAIDTWKWDGGHHRTMVDPNYGEVGLAYPGPTVLDVGMGDEKAPPVLRERD